VPAPETVEIGSKVTALILVILIHLVVAWDIYASIKWDYRATVSWVIHGWVQDTPVIVLAAGVLIGHICWPLRSGSGL
jgi:hypothetical protein